MTPVRQTVFGPCGNCYAACVASIIEAGVEEVPDLFAAGDSWGGALREWLSSRGLDARFVRGDRQSVFRQKCPPKGWSILGYAAPGRPTHAVVCRDGQIVHDPASTPAQVPPGAAAVLWTLIEGLA